MMMVMYSLLGGGMLDLTTHCSEEDDVLNGALTSHHSSNVWVHNVVNVGCTTSLVILSRKI